MCVFVILVPEESHIRQFIVGKGVFIDCLEPETYKDHQEQTS